MELHLLDLMMYIVLTIVLWYALDLFSAGELTEGLEGVVGIFIMIIFTIIYIVMFVFCDWNWSDIFAGHYESWIKFKL